MVNFIITTSAEVRAVLSQGHRGLVGVYLLTRVKTFENSSLAGAMGCSTVGVAGRPGGAALKIPATRTGSPAAAQ